MPRYLTAVSLVIALTAPVTAIFGLAATANADILTTFDVSGTLKGSPSPNPATFSGSFTLDETTGTLAAIDLNSPVGAFTGSIFDGLSSDFIETTSRAAAFQIVAYIGAGSVAFALGFAGTADDFTGGDILTEAYFPFLPPGERLDNPSGLDCNSAYPACDGNGDGFRVVSGIATLAVPATAPEPGSLTLLGPALVGLGLTLRARRDRNQTRCDSN